MLLLVACVTAPPPATLPDLSSAGDSPSVDTGDTSEHGDTGVDAPWATDVTCNGTLDHPLDDPSDLWSNGLSLGWASPPTTSQPGCPSYVVDGNVAVLGGDCTDDHGRTYSGRVRFTTGADGWVTVEADAWTTEDAGGTTVQDGVLRQLGPGMDLVITSSGWRTQTFTAAGRPLHAFCWSAADLTWSSTESESSLAASVVVDEEGVGAAAISGGEVLAFSCSTGFVDVALQFSGARALDLVADSSCTGCGTWTADDGETGVTCPWAD